jgi:hypothetical protein
MDKTEPNFYFRVLNSLYRLLLRAYPVTFRRIYGPQMLQLFSDICSEAERKSQTGATVRAWKIILLDLIRTIPREHILAIAPTRNVHGLAMMLGGGLFSAGFLLSNANPASVSITSTGMFCMVLSSILLTVGLLGLLTSYTDRFGRAGRAFLLLAALGSAAALTGGLGLAMTGLDWLWGVRMLGLVILFLFLALFGLVCLIRKPLPRFNGLPLLIGLWIPVGGLFGAANYAITGTWLSSGGLAATVILLAVGFGFLLLGNVLRADPINLAASEHPL